MTPEYSSGASFHDQHGASVPRSRPTPSVASWPTWNSATVAAPGPKDRIRNAKDTGLRNLPLHDFAQNQIWIALVQLATELTAWTQMLTLTTSPARRWEPKQLRMRLFSIAGKTGRRNRKPWLRLSTLAPFADLIAAGLGRLNTLPHPT
jgi:hypothetical protein